MDGVKPAALPVAPGIAPTPAAASAAGTARDFEAVFIGQMTKIMMETVETDGPFSGGHAEAMFRGVLAEQLGGAIATRGGFGLAASVIRQIVALQSITPGSAADAR